jgi:hypothetical protein
MRRKKGAFEKCLSSTLDTDLARSWPSITERTAALSGADA